MSRTLRCATVAALVSLAWEPAQGVDVGPLCATPAQVQLIQDAYAKTIGLPPPVLADALGLSQAVVLSALPSDQSIGTTPYNIENIWKSLSGWENAVTLIPKDGHALEVLGPVHALKWSDERKRFELSPDGFGMAGALAAQSVSAIYAISLPTKRGIKANGVLFMNSQGDMSFGIMVPVASGQNVPSINMQFQETMKVIEAMPRLCRTASNSDE